MKRTLRHIALAVPLAVLAPAALSQIDPGGQRNPTESRDDVKLPNGKSQREEILKADHQSNLKDAQELTRLAEQLKSEIEKNEGHVLSLSTLKKTEEIEKLARRIRSRMRRF